ncbi:MAG: MazG family protein [Verrucomicrobiales bacterium]|nr:MazG family protein [Verrucomicrobiales bacterium]
MKRPRAPKPAIVDLLAVMARLRSPTGCPWDQEQDHMSLRFHAVEEVYELMDAIEAGDDEEMMEELGDLLLQVVFHAQLARERKAFNFEKLTRNLVDKLIRRHPHVFGDSKAKDVDAVWAQWEKIKRAEKKGTAHDRPSALDGIPRHLPALLRAEKVTKKARKAKLLPTKAAATRISRSALAASLFDLAEIAQARGWSAEELLRSETKRRERAYRKAEVSHIQSASHSR